MIKTTGRGICVAALSVLLLLAVGGCTESEGQAEPLERVAFGSCASQDRDQPIWDAILAQDPDLFLFIGDNIYADTEDMDVMRRKYGMLADKPGYRQLRATCPVLSTWDDHDYGVNDGGASYPKRKASEEVFLDFFEVPEDSPRRDRPGVYGADISGPPGQRVQVVLLDTRYFKDADKQEPNPISEEEKEEQNLVGWYSPTDDTTTTILGEAQWGWLEQQLQRDADLRIIASSIQVVPYEKGMESWGNYPHERRRLFQLIEETGAEGVLFVSGDVHFAEVSRSDDGPYPFYDFTSSGLTNTNESWSQAVNSYRLGEAFAEPNFGLVRIDWDRDGPVVHLEAYDVEGRRVLHQEVPLSQLQASAG